MNNKTFTFCRRWSKNKLGQVDSRCMARIYGTSMFEADGPIVTSWKLVFVPKPHVFDHCFPFIFISLIYCFINIYFRPLCVCDVILYVEYFIST